MVENEALWLRAKGADWEEGQAPYPKAGPNEIVVGVHAIAVNPIDRLLRTVGGLIASYLRYPAVLGSDVAGEVVEVGEAVTRFGIGDRVLGFAAGSDKTRNRAAEGAFQRYVVLMEHMVSALPDGMTFDQGAVLPLGIATAASGLFAEDFLALEPPSTAPSAKGRTLLVWGGSTSIGSNAIQLAVAAGYEVVTTASPHNFGYVTWLGATRAFDHHSGTVVQDLVRFLADRDVVGAIAIGPGSSRACIDVISRCQGECFVAMATTPASFDAVPARGRRLRKLVPAMMQMMLGTAALALRARRRGVRTKFIWGSALIGNEVGPLIFERYLPDALASGRYAAAPPPQIVGHGLAKIPEALERQRQGVSATKLVVTI